MWLNLSGSLPLSIAIESYVPVGFPDMTCCLRAVLVHLSRIQYLDLWSVELREVDAELLQHQLPLLHAAGLTIDRCSFAVPTPLFHAAPRLRSLTIRSLHSHTLFPWSQLTSFVCSSFELSPFAILVLGSAVNLVHCTLASLSVRSSFPAMTPLLRLESLTISHLSFTLNVPSFEGFLAALTLPALRRLQIPDALLGRDPIPTLRTFISRTGCSLQELRVIGPTFDREAFQAAFPSIPEVLFIINRPGDESDDDQGWDSDY
jgi:hypothetical protein